MSCVINSKSNYKNKIISLSPLTYNFLIISNYTHKITTRLLKKIIIPNSVHIFDNKYKHKHKHIVPNSANKYNVHKIYYNKKNILNIFYNNEFHIVFRVSNFLLENINKIIMHQINSNFTKHKQNMLYLKNIKNVTIFNDINYVNISVLKNIYRFYITSAITNKNIQNIFLLNNLCVLSVDDLILIEKDFVIDFSKIKRIYMLQISGLYQNNIHDIYNLMYVSKLRIEQLNICNIYAISTIHELCVFYFFGSEHIKLTMFKNIKNIKMYKSDISDISCLKNIHTLHISYSRVIIDMHKLTNIHTLKIKLSSNIKNIDSMDVKKLKNIHTLITNIRFYKNAILNNFIFNNNCVEFIYDVLPVESENIQHIKYVKHIKFTE